MRVSISSDGRFSMTPDGAVWTDGPFGYRLWTRYLSVFDGVNVIARVTPVKSVLPKVQQANGPDVSFSPVPYFIGPTQYLRHAWAVRRAAQSAIGADDAVILNVPGHIASCMAPVLANRPYAAHVISDSRDTFAPGVFRHPLRPFLRWWLSRNLRRQVAGAAAALYVTQRTLQSRYPCPGVMAGISDVDLPEEAFVAVPRTPSLARGPTTLLTIGTMSTEFTKGHDLLIDALAVCRSQGVNLRLVLVGGGRYQPMFEARVRRLGLQQQVEFRGQIPAGPVIRAELDAADLFVFPSRIEGLPRALVEAMARGLPCISTPVGGIAELLPADDLVPVGDAAALASKIQRVVADPALQAEMSARNLRKANEYRADTLRQKWDQFFRYLAEQTQGWRDSNGSRRSTTRSPAIAAGAPPRG